MKVCICGSRDFSVTQSIQVKFLLDDNLRIVGHEMRMPPSPQGIIRCEKCGKQYTSSSIESIEANIEGR